jgi:hypothetical protein
VGEIEKKKKSVEEKMCAEKLYAYKVSGRKKYIQVHVGILLDRGCWVQSGHKNIRIKLDEEMIENTQKYI